MIYVITLRQNLEKNLFINNNMEMVLPYYGNGALFKMLLRQGGLCNLLLPIYFLFYSVKVGFVISYYLFIFFFTVVKVGFVISYYLFIFFLTVAQS